MSDMTYKALIMAANYHVCVSQIKIWNIISEDHVYTQIKFIRGDPVMR